MADPVNQPQPPLNQAAQPALDPAAQPPAAQPQPPLDQEQLDELEELQQELQDRFELYRNATPWIYDDRQDQIKARNVPRRQGNILGGGANPFNQLRARWYRMRRDARRRAGLLTINQLHARRLLTASERNANIRELKPLLWTFKDRLRFVRALGWSRSFVSLWSWNTPQGRSRRAVLKNALRTDQDRVEIQDEINDERDSLKELARAKHIVQRFRVADLLGAENVGNIDDQNGLLWLEVCQKGDLDALMRKVGSHINDAPSTQQSIRPGGAGIYALRSRYGTKEAGYFPPAVIWQLFECLVRGCIAMSWPPRLQAGPNPDSEHPEKGRYLDDVIPPPGPGNNKREIIHFDIDPHNIFIGEYDKNHVEIPLFKIADFGMAEPAAKTFNNEQPPYTLEAKIHMWVLRTVGKNGIHPPEQFTVEWDRVNLHSDPFTDGISTIGDLQTTAGHFGAWTNIWQIGTIMWSCITLMHPNSPPFVEPMPAGSGTLTGKFSYGCDILDQEYIDRYGRDMCELVAWCMMHRPGDRPTLAQLQASLAAMKPARDRFQDCTTWVRRYIKDPPASRPRVLLYPAAQYNAAGNLRHIRMQNEDGNFVLFNPFWG